MLFSKPCGHYSIYDILKGSNIHESYQLPRPCEAVAFVEEGGSVPSS